MASSNGVTDAGFTTLVGTYRFTTDVTGKATGGPLARLRRIQRNDSGAAK